MHFFILDIYLVQYSTTALNHYWISIKSTIVFLPHRDLSMNELAFLPRRLFRANPALLEVDLSHNVLADLPEGLLISQRNLTVLDVSSNQIEEMKGDDRLIDKLFLNVNFLYHLSLSRSSCL